MTNFELQIKAMRGNLCRGGTYVRIRRAIRAAEVAGEVGRGRFERTR